MATSYTGIYSIKDSSGRITDVQVQDTGGNGLPLPIGEYERRGVQPPAESLPDQNSYRPS